MGTRGFIGIVIDGDTKISFNHFDSYPDGLGVALPSDAEFFAMLADGDE